MVLCVYFMSRASEASTDSGSGLKRPRDGGHSLKFHPTDWWSRGSNLGLLYGQSFHV